MARIAVLGALDTKGLEHQFVADRIRQLGHTPLLIDVGTGDDPVVTPDITRGEVAASAAIDLTEATRNNDRGKAVAAMAAAAAAFLPQLHRAQPIDGVIALGGGGGTSIATAAMRALPIGVPKLMVSTLAGGDTSAYVGGKDIVMFPSVLDVAGLNRISQRLFAQAAGAICGMAETTVTESEQKPLVVASMFGNTTQCVTYARELLEQSGYEVLVFHATGSGGRAMEDLIRSGMVSGVLDVTTTELADELVGGVMSAGPTRLTAAGELGIPAVIAPGCLDMVNFGPPDTLPDSLRERTLYAHNPEITLLRTNVEECRELGKRLAERTRGPASILAPARAISVLSAAGQPFHDPQADAALLDAIAEHATVEFQKLDMDINSSEFATSCVETLVALMHERAAAGG